ncbi:MAG: NUDIX domain-containing protein [archaeon]
MPRFIIVNEKDEIISYKNFDEIKTSDIYRVSALWVINSKGEILLAQRAFTKSHDPGKWGPAVAGTVEEGETYKENIINEAEEELGLKELNLLVGQKKRVQGKHNYFCQWFLLTIDRDITDFKIQEEEVASIKWFAKEELLKKINENPKTFIPSMRKTVRLFLS